MTEDSLTFFNPYEEIRQTRNRLPHWQQSGATYFVTFRLGDSIPTKLLAQHRLEKEDWLAKHPRPWTSNIERRFHEIFSSRTDDWMDQGSGSCILGEVDARRIVNDSLLHFESERTVMISFVIMPNHVHAVFSLNPEWKLEEILHSWKSFSSKEIGRLKSGTGVVWQRDYFDRLIRDDDHFRSCVRYVRKNPIKASLSPNQFTLYENDLAKSID